MLHMSEPGYAVTRAFEGRALRAYRDEVGVWTIGYGNTNDESDVLGFTIKAGVTITEAQADQLLRAAMVRKYEPAVNQHMGPDVTQPAFDAGGSFHYNTGAIARASWVKSYVAKNMPGVHEQIMVWNKAGGKVLAGLTRRRNREWLMISAGDYGPEGRQTVITDERGHVIPGAVAPVVVPSVAIGVKPADDPHAIPPGLHQGPGMLKQGDTGPEVVEFKQSLTANGYDVSADAADTFGDMTEKSVRDYQHRHPQLNEDGIAGPATRASLARTINAKSAVATTVKTAATTTATSGTADAAMHGGMPSIVYVALAVVFIGAMLYVTWKYRDEIIAEFKPKVVL